MLKNAYDKKSQDRRSLQTPGNNADNHISSDTATAVVETPRFVAPAHGGVDILKLLKELEDLVENTPHGPLSTLFRFDEDRFHMTIMKIRANLPEEMKRASKLATDSERIVVEARENAGRLLDDTRKVSHTEREQAHLEAVRMRDEAQNEANRIRSRAESEAARLRGETEREAERLLMEARASGEQVVAAARGHADRILDEGRMQAEHLVSESEILREACSRAQDLERSAMEEAMAIRAGADNYARDILENLEDSLSGALGQIRRGRDLLERQN